MTGMMSIMLARLKEAKADRIEALTARVRGSTALVPSPPRYEMGDVSIPTPQELSDEEKYEREVRAKALDFQIEKLHGALVESNKTETIAFLTYATLMLLTAILIFGTTSGVADKVAIPFINLTVNKYFAAFVALFLSAAALYWFTATNLATLMFTMKLNELLGQRYSKVIKSIPRLLHFPSIVGLTGAITAAHKVVDAIAAALFFLVLAASIISMPILAWAAGSASGYSLTAKLLLCGANIVTLIPTVTLRFFLQDKVTLDFYPDAPTLVHQKPAEQVMTADVPD